MQRISLVVSAKAQRAKLPQEISTLHLEIGTWKNPTIGDFPTCICKCRGGTSHRGPPFRFAGCPTLLSKMPARDLVHILLLRGTRLQVNMLANIHTILG